jgi:predicted dinucleotide-binding enzyme
MNGEAIMRIAIIGAGSVGGTLGQAWLKHGEEVVWGLRDHGVAITTISAPSTASAGGLTRSLGKGAIFWIGGISASQTRS